MAYRSMSLAEFATHINMDAREVRRLADRGKLPGHKLAGKWRFNRAQVTEWLQQHMHTLDESRLIALESSMSGNSSRRDSDSDMAVTSLIGLEGVDVAFPARTRASVLRELVKLADRTGLLYDGPGLLDAVAKRETLCSTALPNGIAIPHPRQPMPYVSAEPLICVARLSKGVGFGAPAGELTRFFFLICCHNDREHLHVLARLMRILDDRTVDLLHDVESREGLLEVLMAKEAQVVARTSKHS